MSTDKSDSDGPSQNTRSGTTRDGITPHDDGLSGKQGKGTTPSKKRRQTGNNHAQEMSTDKSDLGNSSRTTRSGTTKNVLTPHDERLPGKQGKGTSPSTKRRQAGNNQAPEKAGLYPDLSKVQEENEKGNDYEDQRDESKDPTNDSFDNNIQADKKKKNSPSPKSTPKANRRPVPIEPTDKTIPDDVDGRATHTYGQSRGTHRGVENSYRYRGTKDKNRDYTDVNSKKNSSGQTAWSLILIIAICMVFVGVRLVMIDHWHSSNDESAEMMQPVDYYKLFKPKFEKIKGEFGSQTPRFWKIIGSALKRLLNAPIPTYPAVIIVAVPRGYSSMASCLAKNLVSELNSVFDYTGECYIDSSALNDAAPAKTKLDLDEKLISILSNSHGVVLDHIDILPAQAALLLHGYADGDNAPYKNAAILLVLQSDVKHGEINEKLVEKILTQKWVSVLGRDEMPALLSRIANSIAILSPEEGISCD